MEKLTELKCVPCQGGIEPLKGKALEPLAREVPRWEIVDEHHLRRAFGFRNFAAALTFVNQVGELAEQMAHHPEICFTWGRVTIQIHTHKIDGLHRNDFVLAAHIDRLEGAGG